MLRWNFLSVLQVHLSRKKERKQNVFRIFLFHFPSELLRATINAHPNSAIFKKGKIQIIKGMPKVYG
jgi:hypothetical protein